MNDNSGDDVVMIKKITAILVVSIEALNDEHNNGKTSANN